MKFNKQLIEQLKAGDIILHYNESNLELLRAVLSETFPEDKWETSGEDKYYYKAYPAKKENGWSCDKCIPGRYTGCKVIPLSDFLLPEPKFKKGDKVRITLLEDEGEWIVRSQTQHPDTGNWAYLLEQDMFNRNISEGLLELVMEPKFKSGDRVILITDTEEREVEVDSRWYNKHTSEYFYYLSNMGVHISYAERLLTLVPEPSFIVGNEYEFEIEGVLNWQKGTLMAIIDDNFKYIVRRNNGTIVAFSAIRPIQPKEVTKDDLVFLLRQWEDYYRRNALILSDDRYSESMFHLSAHTDSVLYNLSTQTKES